MTPEEIQKLAKETAAALDLSKFKGDIVAFKYVENEINNVDKDGIGIQNNYYPNGAQHEQTESTSPSPEQTLVEQKTIDTAKDIHVQLFIAAMKKMQSEIYCNKPLEPNIKNMYEWYAVYKLAKDIGLIANFEDFLQLMDGDEWKQKPAKIQNFQLHQDAIDENTAFPNWICPRSGQTKFFNKFLHIASITYSIYKLGCQNRGIKPFE